ncbi:hypothetical protein NST48_25430 [Paenibacillus sp. FSL M7-0547]|uniref:hypothetical protein n=1 Tax=Paenibacillus sp. FSL M7-0547 TaxID=2954755 RepID=UPI0030F7589B
MGHDERYVIEPTKLENLGWNPRYNFENGIAQKIQWELTTPNGGSVYLTASTGVDL